KGARFGSRGAETVEGTGRRKGAGVAGLGGWRRGNAGVAGRCRLRLANKRKKKEECANRGEGSMRVLRRGVSIGGRVARREVWGKWVDQARGVGWCGGCDVGGAPKEGKEEAGVCEGGVQGKRWGYVVVVDGGGCGSRVVLGGWWWSTMVIMVVEAGGFHGGGKVVSGPNQREQGK
ncbi:hypothetical protein SOVF_113400, partial [Spinacia oleracea]